ncbi:MAG: Na/Pi cotransporter family protein [Deltaproteobacteria bacterium]|nr:Na/Pi cotransporter family protein [Deltaproteobacteria bacterium]
MSTISLVSLFGAIMLMLYGMRLAGEGLQKAAGAQLKSFLLSATSNRFKSLGVGAVITAIFQSSSATTVMLVGFVGAGLMGLQQTMGVILGADIGTTLTVQLIAFKVYDWAVGLIGAGIVLRFISRRGSLKHVGQAVLGFGFVFFALKILIEIFEPVTQNPLLHEFLVGFSKDPLAGIIISALLTALFQSSAATLGIAITAAHTGLLTLDAAMPIVLGANIGSCVSALVSSLGAGVEARRVGVAHVLFKVTGVIIVIPVLAIFTHLVGLASSDPGRQVALAHTFFNVALAVIFIPFTRQLTALVERIMPPGEETAGKFGPKYLDPIVISSPSLALVQASREALRAADIVGEMLRQSIIVFVNNDMELLEKIEERDDEIDLLDREIKLYLTKLTRESLSDEQSRREMETMLFTDNMENIGDVIDKNLMDLARKKIRTDASFSKDGQADIVLLHLKVVENFDMCVAAFAGGDAELAQRLLNHKAKIAELERELRSAHMNRLRLGLKESIDTSAIHLDVLTNLKRINSCIVNAAYPMVERGKR